MAGSRKVSGSAKDGAIDSRSGDASGKQADEAKSHAELAKKSKPGTDRPQPQGEAAGALKDRTAR